jgi:hypothetical protein
MGRDKIVYQINGEANNSGNDPSRGCGAWSPWRWEACGPHAEPVPKAGANALDLLIGSGDFSPLDTGCLRVLSAKETCSLKCLGGPRVPPES